MMESTLTLLSFAWTGEKDRKAERQKDRKNRKTERQADRQKDRTTERQKDIKA
jgi:hypothetical protein